MPLTKLSRAPRKTPLQSRSAITVNAILEAAVHIFKAEGYHGATTVKVADRAGVSIGSLYQYFPNKLALLAAVKQRMLARLFEGLERALTGPGAGIDGLRRAIRFYLQEAASARALWLAFAAELPARLAAPVTATEEATHVRILREFLEKHRNEFPVPATGLAALVVGEMVDAVTRAALRDRPRDFAHGVLEAELLDAVSLYLKGKKSSAPPSTRIAAP